MNGKAAKTLRTLKKDSHKDKKHWRSLSQHEKYVMRMASKTVKSMRKNNEHSRENR